MPDGGGALCGFERPAGIPLAPQHSLTAAALTGHVERPRKEGLAVHPAGVYPGRRIWKKFTRAANFIVGVATASRSSDQVDRILWTASNSIKDWLDTIGATMAELQNAVTPDNSLEAARQPSNIA